MIEQFYRVFLSSTFRDLRGARAGVIASLLESGHYPMVMEYQPGAPGSQIQNLKTRLQRSDMVLVLLADSYGTRIIGDHQGRSFTEFEFDTAMDLELPVIPLIRERKPDSAEEKLVSFYRKLSAQKLAPGYWTDPRDLPAAAVAAVDEARKRGVIGCVPVRGVIRSFLDPLTDVSLGEPLTDEYAHDVADRAGLAIEHLRKIDTRRAMKWKEYCDFVHRWLEPITTGSCEIRAVCSQKPWHDEVLDDYFQIYYALAERDDCPCTVVRLFVERQDWGTASNPPTKGSAWYHLHQHLCRDRIAPLVIRRSQLGDLRTRLRKYGDISGFVLVSQQDKLVSAMIHHDTEDGIHAALFHSAEAADMFPFLLGIFDDLRRNAQEFTG